MLEMDKLRVMARYLEGNEPYINLDCVSTDLRNQTKHKWLKAHHTKESKDWYWAIEKDCITLQSYNTSHHNGDTYSDDRQDFKIDDIIYSIMFAGLKVQALGKVKGEVSREEKEEAQKEVDARMEIEFKKRVFNEPDS